MTLELDILGQSCAIYVFYFQITNLDRFFDIIKKKNFMLSIFISQVIVFYVHFVYSRRKKKFDSSIDANQPAIYSRSAQLSILCLCKEAFFFPNQIQCDIFFFAFFLYLTKFVIIKWRKQKAKISKKKIVFTKFFF